MTRSDFDGTDAADTVEFACGHRDYPDLDFPKDTGKCSRCREEARLTEREAEMELPPLLYPDEYAVLYFNDHRDTRIQTVEHYLMGLSLPLPSILSCGVSLVDELVIPTVRKLLSTNFWRHPDNWEEGKSSGHWFNSAIYQGVFGNKAAWLEAVSTPIGPWYHDFVVDAAAAHCQTRADCIPLIQSPDPELRQLGLKLVASLSGTLADAETTPVRVPGR